MLLFRLTMLYLLQQLKYCSNSIENGKIINLYVSILQKLLFATKN